MKGSFPAMLFRMKYISRWSLMYNTQPENLSQHSMECSLLVHFLANIGNVYFGKGYNPDKLSAYALYHDAAEVLTGDLPTPIKYFSEDMRNNYKLIEESAVKRMLELLPDELGLVYEAYFEPDSLNEDERRLLKIADRLCAHIKCILELEAGNKEFSAAYYDTLKNLKQMGDSDELNYFTENCLGFFSLSIHELKGSL